MKLLTCLFATLLFSEVATAKIHSLATPEKAQQVAGVVVNQRAADAIDERNRGPDNEVGGGNQRPSGPRSTPLPVRRVDRQNTIPDTLPRRVDGDDHPSIPQRGRRGNETAR